MLFDYTALDHIGILRRNFSEYSEADDPTWQSFVDFHAEKAKYELQDVITESTYLAVENGTITGREKFNITRAELHFTASFMLKARDTGDDDNLVSENLGGSLSVTKNLDNRSAMEHFLEALTLLAELGYPSFSATHSMCDEKGIMR